MKQESKHPSIKKNFAYNTFFQVFSIIIPFVTAPYLARVLGAETIGIQSYTSSVETYFALVAALGTSGYGAREIARTRDNKKEYSKLFWEIELLSILMSVCCILVWGIFVLTARRYKTYFAILTLNLFGTMFNITWLFRGLEQFKLTVIRDTFFKLAGIVLIFLLVKTPEDLWIYMLILSVSTLLSSLSLWGYLPVVLDKVSWKELRIFRHFKETVIYFIPTIATSIYKVLDKTLIGLMTVAGTENGYYEQAEKIINMAQNISFTALNSVMGMRISYLFAKNKLEEINRRIETSFHFIFFMSFGCMFGIIGIAENFVPVFYGKGYDKVVTLLYVFAPIIVIIGISVCLGGHYYTPSGRRAISARFLIIGACVNLVLNLLMIPLLGSIGAAIASVAAETTISFLYVRYSEGYCSVALLWRTGWKKMCAGIGMLMIVRLTGMCTTGSPVLTLVIQVGIGVISYVLLLLCLQDTWVLNMLKNIKQKMRRLCSSRGHIM
jgi:O-antigen/teichoic acid export membrane protein